ncbi:hypothetical protein [Fulvivirga aurantia]|uniref:hypothetical protein n=1 Tax=Fulvivirga aurantia TaxID=2529383 RepID=UPI0012BCEB20|nr:hypothetical protein [Fulvivirga aurantia]
MLNQIERMDSLALLSETDTLKVIGQSLQSRVDSVKHDIELSKIDSITQTTQHTIDSLSALNLPTEKYQQKLDSLLNKYPDQLKAKSEELQAVVNEKLEETKDKLTQKLQVDTNVPSEIEEKLPTGELPNVTENIPNTNISKSLPEEVTQVEIPGKDKLPENPLQEIDNPLLEKTEGISNKVKGIGSEPKDKIEDIKSSKKVGDLSSALGEVKEHGEKLSEVNQEMAEAKAGDWEGVEERAEKEIVDQTDLSALDEQTDHFDVLQSEIEEHKQLGEKYQDPAFVKQRILEKSKYVAKDALKAYKEKVANARRELKEFKPDSIHFKDSLRKYRPMKLKDKSFAKRFLVGVNWEVTRQTNTNFDIAPFAGYRLNKKMNAWFGYMYRVRYNNEETTLNQKSTAYGPRISLNYDVYKGFYLRSTIERFRVNISSEKRAWVNGALIGIGKDYKIGGRLKGDVHAMYNLLYDSEKTPYNKRFNLRFGFYLYKLDKKKKPSWKGKLEKIKAKHTQKDPRHTIK